jgi:hypothetical protein
MRAPFGLRLSPLAPTERLWRSGVRNRNAKLWDLDVKRTCWRLYQAALADTARPRYWSVAEQIAERPLEKRKLSGRVLRKFFLEAAERAFARHPPGKPRLVTPLVTVDDVATRQKVAPSHDPGRIRGDTARAAGLRLSACKNLANFLQNPACLYAAPKPPPRPLALWPSHSTPARQRHILYAVATNLRRQKEQGQRGHLDMLLLVPWFHTLAVATRRYFAAEASIPTAYARASTGSSRTSSTHHPAGARRWDLRLRDEKNPANVRVIASASRAS